MSSTQTLIPEYVEDFVPNETGFYANSDVGLVYITPAEYISPTILLCSYHLKGRQVVDYLDKMSGFWSFKLQVG